MDQKITHEIILKSFYGELSLEENLQLELSLLTNNQLQSEYDGYNKVLKSLDDLALQPSKKIVSDILKYSKGTLIPAH